MNKEGDRQACLGVNNLSLIDRVFNFSYWKNSSDTQDHQNDLLTINQRTIFMLKLLFLWSLLPFRCLEGTDFVKYSSK